MKNTKNSWKHFHKKKITRRHIISLVKGIGILTGVAILFFNRIWMLVVLSPYLWFWMKDEEKRFEEKRREQLQKECSEFFQSLTNCLSAGYSLESSIPVVRKELSVLYSDGSSILIQDLQKIERQLRMNERFEELFEAMARNHDNEDLLQFAFVLKIAKRRGGNLIEILEKTIVSLRQKNRVDEEIKTLLSGRIFEKNIMKGVPFFLVGYMRVFNGDYIQVLYDSFAGNCCMAASLIMMILAGKLADKIVEIEV